MLKVMIADDNEGMRLVLKKAVEKAGHQVVAMADCGEKAVELARSEVSPMDDVRATKAYRLEVVGVVLARSLRALM